MSVLERALQRLGHAWTPLSNDVEGHEHVRTASRCGDVVYVSGQVPFRNGEVITGKVGESGLSLEEAKEAAGLCALQCLYAAGSVLRPEYFGRVLSMMVYVNSMPGFNQMSEVADGASAFLVAALDEDGRSTRAALGVASIPYDAPVEIVMTIEVC